jgi:hypothetical protein
MLSSRYQSACAGLILLRDILAPSAHARNAKIVATRSKAQRSHRSPGDSLTPERHRA